MEDRDERKRVQKLAFKTRLGFTLSLIALAAGGRMAEMWRFPSVGAL
jgi:SNF family Na+-dependent transporter